MVVAELIMAIYGIPIDITSSVLHGWKMGRNMCYATGFLLTLSGKKLIDHHIKCNKDDVAFDKFCVVINSPYGVMLFHITTCAYDVKLMYNYILFCKLIVKMYWNVTMICNFRKSTFVSRRLFLLISFQ